MGCAALKYHPEKEGLNENGPSVFWSYAKKGSQRKACVNYYPGGSVLPGRSYSSNSYRYGYQGSEKDDEITGVTGAHITTHFRELDTRLLRWWSTDPKANASESPYMSMGGNPLWNNDPLGDTVKTSQEGADIINEGLDGTLGDKNPFKYNKDDGILTYGDFDRNDFSKDQLEVIDHMVGVIDNEKTTTVNVVDMNEEILYASNFISDGLGKKSLKDIGKAGATSKDGKTVYLARDPQMVGSVPNPNYGPNAPHEKPMVPGWVPAPGYDRGRNAVHEVGGHVYYRFTKPKLSQSDHDDVVEQFENNFRQIYKIGTYSGWKAFWSFGKHKKGDPIYMGGEAAEH